MTETKGELVQRVDADFGVYEPAGRKSLNPQSRLGAAMVEVAKEWSLNPVLEEF